MYSISPVLTTRSPEEMAEHKTNNGGIANASVIIIFCALFIFYLCFPFLAQDFPIAKPSVAKCRTTLTRSMKAFSVFNANEKLITKKNNHRYLGSLLLR